MCALTIAPPSPSSSPQGSSSGVLPAKLRVQRPGAERTVSLSFCDLHVCAEDVTTVGEALAGCSPEDLLGAVMRHEAGWRIPPDTVGNRAHQMLASRIGRSLQAMRELEDAAVALTSAREGFVGPAFRFEVSGKGAGLELRVEAVVLEPEDGPVIEEVLGAKAKRVNTWDELRRLQCEGSSEAALAQVGSEALHATPAILSRLPWARVLALPLWLPRCLNEEERRGILARVFWSMTYHGFTQGPPFEGSTGVSIAEERARMPASQASPWPTNPVLAVLNHNCWVDTLEAWDALFIVMGRA